MNDLKKVDVRLAVTDLPVEDLPWMITCRQPDHDDSTMSMAVYPGHLTCYGCGFAIRRRMEALAYLLGITVVEAIKLAPRYTVESLDAYRERAALEARRNPLPKSLATSYRSLLLTSRRDSMDWLLSRGLTEKTIRNTCLGHDSTRFTIPFYDKDKNLITIRFRRDDRYGVDFYDYRSGQMRTIPKYSGMPKRNGLYLYPEWRVAKSKAPYLVVVEGELDALRLWQEGIPAASVTNGAGNVRHILKLLESYPHINTLYIATDQDDPGVRARYELSRQAKQAGYGVAWTIWNPDWGKDVTELYANGHTLESADWYPHGAWSKRNT